ncbi:MAG: hypothetical protein QOF98_2025 [Streptomyces sp.]|nr:hypothetical protein [Streptomyces sp.]
MSRQAARPGYHAHIRAMAPEPAIPRVAGSDARPVPDAAMAPRDVLSILARSQSTQE